MVICSPGETSGTVGSGDCRCKHRKKPSRKAWELPKGDPGGADLEVPNHLDEDAQGSPILSLLLSKKMSSQAAPHTDDRRARSLTLSCRTPRAHGPHFVLHFVWTSGGWFSVHGPLASSQREDQRGSQTRCVLLRASGPAGMSLRSAEGGAAAAVNLHLAFSLCCTNASGSFADFRSYPQPRWPPTTSGSAYFSRALICQAVYFC